MKNLTSNTSLMHNVKCSSLENSSFDNTKKINQETRSVIIEEWLDTTQAAAYLKLTVGALRNMTSNGQVPYHKLGKRNRYRVDDLRQLLLSQKRGVIYGN